MKPLLKLISVVLCFATSLILSVTFHGNAVITSVSADDVTSVKEMPLVIVDAGHGGEDGGAVSESGVMEKDINLSIALYLKDFLVQGGFRVMMIREDDNAVYDSYAKTLREKKVSDIHKRSEICNNSENNIYISIHQNKFSQSKYSGAQVFYSEKSHLSKLLADNIRVSIRSLLQNGNERNIKPADDSIYILKNAEVPCVLVECGFLSNREELQKLESETYRQSMAYCIYLGFCEFYYNNYE